VEEWVRELLKLNEQPERVTDKQLRIVQAAVQMFSEKGFAATSTSEIAQKAGVAEGTIFKHFKSKKELLITIVSPIMTKLIKPFVLRDFYQVLDSSYPTFEEFLRAVISNRLVFARKYWPVMKVMLQEIPFHPELKKQYLDVVAKQVAERMEQLIVRYQQDGSIRSSIPPATVLRMCVSIIVGYLGTRFFIAPDEEWDDERETELCIEFIMHGLGGNRT
jgi:AcrR family transcriptional regulator